MPYRATITKSIRKVYRAYLKSWTSTSRLEAAPDIELPPLSEMEHTVKVEEDSLFEALFEMTTLMGDLARLRSDISELWTSYKAGGIELAAVSVTKKCGH